MEIINVSQWIEANKKHFLPPVCDKLMHNTQLKVMFIGGPNVRRDYHCEDGEELFFMWKGDMCLKIIEKGRRKEITIKEGEIFLLPAKISHSPQRKENTVGIVIERERLEHEKDTLRYFVGETTQPLFGRCFHCYNLGTELASIIGEYFASEEHQTGQPNPERLKELPIVSSETTELAEQLKELPIVSSETTELMKPFSLKEWIDKNRSKGGHLPLFTGKYQCDVQVYFGGKTDVKEIDIERWIWQLEGESTLIITRRCYELKAGDSMLLPPGTRFSWERTSSSSALCVIQDGKSK